MSGIREHYTRHELQKCVLPILTLIRVSPNALREFLFGDWEPFGIDQEDPCDFYNEGTECLQYFLFRLLFIAINDLALHRTVDLDNRVKWADFRPHYVFISAGPQGKSECPPSLLEILLVDGHRLSYDASFNTNHDYYTAGNDVVEKPKETAYSFSSGISLFPIDRFLRYKDLPDLHRFFTTLASDSSFASQYILSKLPNLIQNIFKIYGDEPLKPDSWAGKEIVDAFNYLLLEEDLYSQKMFPELTLTDSGGKILNGEYYFSDPWWVYESKVSCNREFLSRIFEDDFQGKKRGGGGVFRYFE